MSIDQMAKLRSMLVELPLKLAGARRVLVVVPLIWEPLTGLPAMGADGGLMGGDAALMGGDRGSPPPFFWAPVFINRKSERRVLPGRSMDLSAMFDARAEPCENIAAQRRNLLR